MAIVNRNVYPIVSQNDKYILSQTADALSYNANWDDSIAISASTRPNAPFNQITVLAHKSGTRYKSVITKSVQKIGLYYPTSNYNGNFLSAYGQYLNSYIDGVAFADETDYSALAATRRSPVSGSWWENSISSIQRDKGHYQLLSGLNIQSVLGIICCGFRNGDYCSLSYYNEHKNSMTQPCNLFLRILTKDSRDIFVFDTLERDFALFEITSSNAIVERNWFTPLSDMLPPYMGMQYNVIGSPSANSPYQYATNGYPTLISPILGCAMGGRFVENDTFNSASWQDMDKAHGHAIFGGEMDVDYTLTVINGYYYTVLTEKGLSQAFALAATYGLPFSAEFPDTWDSLYSSDIDVYMPIANDDGYFNGDFELLSSNGVVNPDLSQENQTIWNGGVNAPYNDRYYDPTITNYVNEIEMTEPTLTAYDAFNRSYIITRDDVDSLGSLIWGANDSTIDLMLKGLQLFGENPINGIINLKLYPFDVRAKLGGGTAEYIKIGRYNTQIAGHRIPENAQCTIDLGTAKIKKFFDNFLDYEPFTQMELYIPFVGTIPISPQQFSGKTIDIKMICDFITGACCVVVYATDENKRYPVIYKNGNIGVEIPLTGNDATAQSSAVLSNVLGVTKDAGSVAANVGEIAATGGAALPEVAGDMVSSGVSAAKHLFGAAAVPTMYQNAGSATPQCSLYLPSKPYLIIYTVEPMEIENYSHLIGFACYEDVTIGNCTGFSTFDNIEMNIDATDTEKNEIYSLLRGGVYV